MFKKALSIMLSLMLVVSAFSMAVVSTSAAETDNAVNANADTEVDSVGADTLTVTATSNLFPSQTYTFTKDELAANNNKVTVTYFINSEKDMLNSQWALRYDEAGTGLLTVNPADNVTENDDEEIISTVMPKAPDAVINFETDDTTPTIRGNCTKLGLYKLSKKGAYVPFVSVTFTANGTGEAKVDLDIEEMAVSKLQPGKTQTQEEDEEQLITGSAVQDVTFNYTTGTEVYEGADKKDTHTDPVVPTTAVPTTEEATTVAETTEEPSSTVAETTEEPTTVAETTAEPTTVAQTTEKPADDKLTVKVTSNVFGESVKSYDASTKQITVVYEVNAPGFAAVNADVEFTYDPEVFTYADSNTDESICPIAGAQFVPTTPKTPLFGQEGIVTGNFSDVNNKLKMYNADGTPVKFFVVVFDVKDGAKGETTVDLNFKNLRVCPEDKLPENDSILIAKKSTLQVDPSELEKFGLNDYSTDGKEEEPTTEAPTTVEPTTAPAPADDVYSVAGSIDELGKWDATSVATEMTKGDDGKYSFTTAITAQNDVLFKVVKNHSWDTAYGDNGNNVSFNVTKDCDVTITFDPATEEITVTGEGVEQPKVLEIESMRAVGNGEGNWLNGVAWDPANDANLMTKVADGIYEITFENVGASFGYDVKCAANGSWAANWGVPKNSGFKPESGVQFDAGWDGDNAGFEVDEDGATVKVQIDVSNFDLASKSGAKMTITVSYPEPSGKLYGDINGDGQITIDDATTLQKYIVKMVDLDDDAKICADVNGDGRISVMDVTFIQRYLAGSTGKAYGYENLTGKVAIPENV